MNRALGAVADVGGKEGGHGRHRHRHGGVPASRHVLGQPAGLPGAGQDQHLQPVPPRNRRRALGGAAGAAGRRRCSTSWRPSSSRPGAGPRGRSATPASGKPQVSTLASRTIRWGGGLILVFLVFHILHFTLGTVHPSFVEGDPYHNVAAGFAQPAAWSLFYELAMAAVGLHLYHGIWSSGRSLGVSAPSPHPIRRQLALALVGDRLGGVRGDSDRGVRGSDQPSVTRPGERHGAESRRSPAGPSSRSGTSTASR